jgi:hypothetical protein
MMMVPDMARQNQTLSIDWSLFTMAFGRDVDYDSVHPQVAWLDMRTGDVIWVYVEDDEAYMEAGIPAEENRQDRERIAAEPDRYLEIPGLDHGDHHDILKAFLRSGWCDDEARMQNAEAAYFGSIGGWKESVNDQDAVHGFYDFQDRRILKLAETYLLENGIVPHWK